MGQYNIYIWTAYGIAGCVLIGVLLHVRYYKNKMRHRLKQWYRLFPE